MPRIVCSESMLANLNMLSYPSVHFFLVHHQTKWQAWLPCEGLCCGFSVPLFPASVCFRTKSGMGEDSIGACLYVYIWLSLFVFFWKRVDVFYLKSYRKGHYWLSPLLCVDHNLLSCSARLPHYKVTPFFFSSASMCGEHKLCMSAIWKALAFVVLAWISYQ